MAAKRARTADANGKTGTTSAARKRKAAPKTSYDCSECPGYCCSIYEIVEVTDRDVERLARHHGLTFEEAERTFTKPNGGVRALRRRKDAILGTSCKFLDPEKRNCTIYASRPTICRSYPGQRDCVYYDVLAFERSVQDEPGALPLIQIRFPSKT